MRFSRKSPCKDCPYRKDAPLQKWDIEEFRNLLRQESDPVCGRVFGCHKKDDHACVGWLMDQDKRFLPSIALRMTLLKNKVTRLYLDALKCKSELYDSVEEMCIANYKKLKNEIGKLSMWS